MKKQEKNLETTTEINVNSTKESYEPPKATVIEIKPEERLLGCNQPTGSCTYGWQN